MPAHFTDVYLRYLRNYQPQDKLLDCTDRNLTYILTRTAKHAQVTKRVTLQLLRDCYAVRLLRGGAALDALREKLGLSDEAWYETREKYRKLAFPV
jgi:integrase/recombinase XerD